MMSKMAGGAADITSPEMMGERLRQLREELGLSKRDLLRKLPLNYSTYANYESGIREPSCEVLKLIAQFYNVSVDFIIGVTGHRRRVDDVLPVSESEYEHINLYRSLDSHGKNLVDLILKSEKERATDLAKEQTTNEKGSKDRVTLQVFNQRASAGLGNYLDDYSDLDFEMRHFEAGPVTTKADFALRIQGDSMEPKYKDNDIVCIRSIPRIDPGQIGIFIYEGESYCKKLKIDRCEGRKDKSDKSKTSKSAIYLESLNEEYPPILIKQPEQLRTVGLVLGTAD